MKKFLIFLAGFISGVVFLLLLSLIIAGGNSDPAKIPGLTLFEQPAEVIAPLSKLQAMLPSGGGQNIKLTLGGQLTAKGRDLVYVLGKENFKTAIRGG